jgi:hypothetical protein
LKTQIPLFFLIIIFFSITYNAFVLAQASSTLTLTVTTDKPTYYSKENVTIYGILTQNGALVPDGLVAIQVQDPKGQTLLIRTTTTGAAPPETPYVKVRSVIPCDSTGGPKDSFERGGLAWFTITVTNYCIESRPALLTVNIYDSSNTPIAYDSTGPQPIGGHEPGEPPTTSVAILCVEIPEAAALGNATAYGNVYTDWPSSNGWPYCTEVSAPFQITNGGSSQSITTTTPQANGDYNLTFQLPAQSKAGNYAIYVSSRYYGEETFNSTTFQVCLLGDLGSGPPPTFFAFDGKVNSWDYALWKACYDGVAPPEAMYLGDLGTGPPPTFFAFDGKVNSWDYALWKACYDGLGP